MTTPPEKTLTERLQEENREAWRCSSGVTTVDWMDTLIAHTIAETLKAVREGVVEKDTWDGSDKYRKGMAAGHNWCRSGTLANLDSLQAETK